MSVSRRPKQRAVAAALASALVVTVIAAVAHGSRPGDAESAPITRRQPTTALPHLTQHRTDDPSRVSVELSRDAFSHASVAVVATRSTAHAAALGAARLHAPLLVDGPAVRGELRRLGVRDVLAVGPVSARTTSGWTTTRARTRAEVPRVEPSLPDADTRTRPGPADVLATGTTAASPGMVNARTAGWHVMKVPGGDPRAVTWVSRVLRSQRTRPVVAVGSGFRDLPYTLAATRSATQQPGGGALLFPGRTLVALYGYPGAPVLGVLGEQGVRASIARAKRVASKYDRLSKQPVVPTFEIIATVASAGKGTDGDYSHEASVATLRPWVDAAQKAGLYVVLDLQPGRASFLAQAQRYRSLLLEPHVGLALDPEWKLTRHQKPLHQIGSVGAGEVNHVGDWLAQLTRSHDLPQKAFVVHQFQSRMIRDRSRLDTSHPELATVLHVDGQGKQPDKQGTWRLLHQGAPSGVFWGWKNFVDEDHPMLTPVKTWTKVHPRPQLITYQ